jgi:AmmeMemoRadiSam system protein B
MKKETSVPQMRTDLEFIPTSFQGQKALLVRDSLGLIRRPVVLQGEALSLVALIDGKRSLREIQVELVRRRKGELVDVEHVEQFIRELDAAYLLQSGHYAQEKGRVLAEYSSLEVREPAHAGVSYPAAASDLGLYLDSILNAAEGEKSVLPKDNICGLVAPHIDLETGRRVYGRAYGTIRGLRPRRVFLLGTGHSLDDGFYSLTEKDYDTPLGRVKTDRAAVRKLKKAGTPVISPSDISHRREHSLEFQVIFLQRLFGSSFSLVPVLCGSFAPELERVSQPSQIAGLDGFLGTLKRLYQEGRSGSLVLAGVDFSHIGPKFGHRERASALLLEAKEHDRHLIETFCRGDIQAFWAESRKARDRYNVCGFPALATLLEILPGAKGLCLDYEFWREEPTQSAVSFAAIVLTEDGEGGKA